MYVFEGQFELLELKVYNMRLLDTGCNSAIFLRQMNGMCKRKYEPREKERKRGPGIYLCILIWENDNEIKEHD